MNALPLALLLILLPLGAAAVQVEDVILSLDQVTRLVTVSSTLDPAKLVLPEHDYEGTVTVNWAVSDSALRSLTTPSVVVYVRVEPVRSDSWLWFQEGSTRVRALTFTLECRVDNGACTQGSRLSRVFTARYRAPANAELPREERLRISASLSPLGASQELLTLQTDVLSRIDSLRSVTDASAREALSAAERFAQQARELASKGEESLALAALEEGRRSAERAQQLAANAQVSASPSSSPSSTASQGGAAGTITGWFSRGAAPLAWGLLLLILIAGWFGWRQWQKRKRWDLDRVAREVEEGEGLATKARKLEGGN